MFDVCRQLMLLPSRFVGFFSQIITWNDEVTWLSTSNLSVRLPDVCSGKSDSQYLGETCTTAISFVLCPGLGDWDIHTYSTYSNSCFGYVRHFTFNLTFYLFIGGEKFFIHFEFQIVQKKWTDARSFR